jgi:hypothetical protein
VTASSRAYLNCALYGPQRPDLSDDRHSVPSKGYHSTDLKPLSTPTRRFPFGSAVLVNSGRDGVFGREMGLGSPGLGDESDTSGEAGGAHFSRANPEGRVRTMCLPVPEGCGRLKGPRHRFGPGRRRRPTPRRARRYGTPPAGPVRERRTYDSLA